MRSTSAVLRDRRQAARWKIVQAANRHALRRHRRSYLPGKPPPRMLGMRQIQQAVCRARRLNLVDGALLEAAGYRADVR